MSETKKIKFSIYRYHPEKKIEGKPAKPYMQDFELEITAGTDMMLLTALKRLHEQDDTLAFRHSCGEGVCGSDGMNINGKNGLACITPLGSLQQPIVIRPLSGFPVIKDLIVDMKNFYQQYEKIQPFLQNNEPAPSKERLQSPEERAKLDGSYECIKCGCCSSSCPSYWWNPDKFLGPAALLELNRFIQDSRDTATNERLDLVGDPYSLFRCRSILNCADVCPKGLNPNKAIDDIRRALIEREA